MQAIEAVQKSYYKNATQHKIDCRYICLNALLGAMMTECFLKTERTEKRRQPFEIHQMSGKIGNIYTNYIHESVKTLQMYLKRLGQKSSHGFLFVVVS